MKQNMTKQLNPTKIKQIKQFRDPINGDDGLHVMQPTMMDLHDPADDDHDLHMIQPTSLGSPYVPQDS